MNAGGHRFGTTGGTVRRLGKVMKSDSAKLEMNQWKNTRQHSIGCME